MDWYMVEILAIRILPTMLFDNRCAILMLLTKAALASPQAAHAR